MMMDQKVEEKIVMGSLMVVRLTLKKKRKRMMMMMREANE